MEINIENLVTVTNFATKNGLSRQHVYRLVENNELTLIDIDGTKFILLDEKATNYKRKRVPKTSKKN